MSVLAYTREDLAKVGDSDFPQRGVFCPRCHTHIPEFAALSKEQEEKIRQLSPLHQMKAVHEATGCNLRWAKIWALHPDGPRSHKNGPPCPYCGEPVFTPASKQCLECGWDWHDSQRPVQHRVKTKADPAATDNDRASPARV